MRQSYQHIPAGLIPQGLGESGSAPAIQTYFQTDK